MKAKIITGLAALLLAFSVPLAFALPKVEAGAQAPVDPELAAMMAQQPAGQFFPVIVILKDQLDVGSVTGQDKRSKQTNLIRALQGKANAAQGLLRGVLKARQAQGHVQSYTPLWILNAIAMTADQTVIDELAKRPEVDRIVPDTTIPAPASWGAAGRASASAAPEQNLSQMNAPALWNLGYYGQGIVVASMDTGVDYTHPDLSGQWRGGSDSWYDPYGQHSTPADVSGHGTWAMGVIVGGSNGGTAIGVAPQARWIAAKIFNDSGRAYTSAIHLGFQWVLDPSGDPAAPDAPDIVDNSWSLSSAGCDLTFEPDLQALVAGGITPVFAAGNFGPNSSTSSSPGNNPDAFAVGATDNGDAIANFSSRGPTSCGRSTSVTYPAVVAPGVNVLTTDLYGLYTNVSGTSFSAPHAAGGLALLLSAFPALTVLQQESALTSSAVDLGSAGPDNTFGAGRIDLLAAYNTLAGGGLPTPTPSPLPTATPTQRASDRDADQRASDRHADQPASDRRRPTTPTVPPTATPTSLPPTATPTPPRPHAHQLPAPDAIFSDGFDTGAFSAWSATGGNTARISVTTGGQGGTADRMQAQISGGASGYVQDNTPANEPTYHARFYFNPNGLTTGSGKNPSTFDVFDGLTTSNMVMFQVQYRRSTNTGYQVRLNVARSGGSSSTGWYAITNNAWNTIEIAWQSGSSASASLYTAGVLRQTLTGLNTSAYTIDTARLGPQGSLGSMSGTAYFDSFVSRRQSVIGP